MAEQKKNRGTIWKEEPVKTEYKFTDYERKMKLDEVAETFKDQKETFAAMLFRLFDEKEAEEPGLQDADIYKRGWIESSHFTKIKKDREYRPRKGTVYAFAVALELDCAQTEALLNSAGYTMSDSKREDLVLKYFIENKRYSCTDINIALDFFDLSTLRTM